MVDKNKLKNAFLRNRAEELPDDVWGSFVIPSHYHANDLTSATKGMVIVGGRGCGKTMFIRYFCHPTRFSKKREHIPPEEIEHVGLYWRPHTQFCSLFSENWLKEKARPAFLHYFSLILIVEFMQAVRNIADSKFEEFDRTIFETKVPKYFSTIIPQLNHDESTLNDLYEVCLDEIDILETWANRPTEDLSYILAPTNSLSVLIRHLERVSPAFKNRNFMFQVFIDEFENLQEEQQRLINDFIKHGKRPLIFSVAMKKHAKISTQTSGEEHIVDGHDFVKIDLEDSLSEDAFRTLAAEITILRLHEAGLFELPTGLDLGHFTDPLRQGGESRKQISSTIIHEVEKILPQPSVRQICSDMIADQSLRKSIDENLRKGIERHKTKEISPRDFSSDDPRAIIVASAVVNRKSGNPSEVLCQLRSYNSNSNSKFSGDGGWIKSSVNGTILQIYKRFPKRYCPLYSGFDRFCKMSRKNIRHYQVLVKHCVTESQDEQLNSLSFPSEVQARAATKASQMLLGEVVRFGRSGEQLLAFIKRMGFLFELSQKRLSQSESEVNHFSIGESDESRLSENARILLGEAKRWSVLFEEQDVTKAKNESEVTTADYVLNPVYAPKFGISIRKNRKITIDPSNLDTLIDGEAEKWKSLVLKYRYLWDSAESDDPQRNLFNEI